MNGVLKSPTILLHSTEPRGPNPRRGTVLFSMANIGMMRANYLNLPSKIFQQFARLPDALKNN